MPTYHVEDTNSTNKGDLLFVTKPRIGSLANRREAARRPEEQESYSVLINSSVKSVKMIYRVESFLKFKILLKNDFLG